MIKTVSCTYINNQIPPPPPPPVCMCVYVCVATLSGRVKLLRQQVIAAAHAANRSQLWFGHEHPQGAGCQVSTRVQSDHDCILESGHSMQRKERREERQGRVGAGFRSMVKFIDDDALQSWRCSSTSHLLQ